MTQIKPIALNQIESFFRYFSLPLLLIVTLLTHSADAQITSTPAFTNDQDSLIDSSAIVVNVDSIMSEMTLDEKIGQLFMVRAYGTFMNDRDLDYLRLKELITDYHVGGILFFQGDIYGQAVTNNQLQELAKYPLWIAQDMEFGAAMRIDGTTRFTPAMGIAATGNPYNAFLKGKITAIEAKAVGVHQIYAPVLDVNNNPENPVINVRSYSADPQMVSEYGIEFMKGVQSEGLVSTGKHFPGHGDTDTDSHLALPTITHDYSRLDSIELVPFRNAINEGMQSIMSAHISFPNISEHEGLPGTLDESILQRILIDSLSFDGLVVTDGLEMQGITSHFSPGQAVIKALQAGVDQMLVSTDEKAAINEIKKAVESGKLTEDRIDKSVRKILTLKSSQGVFTNRFADIETLSYQINTPQFQNTANRIARESITVLKNNNVLPVRQADYPSILVVGISDGDEHSSAGVLRNEIRKYHENVSFHSLDSRTSEEEIDELLDDAKSADLVILGSFIRVSSYRSSHMPRNYLRILDQISSLNKPEILLAFGNPYLVETLPDTDVHLIAWSGAADQVRQTVPAIFGAADVKGKFPGEVPNMYNIGDGLEIPQSSLRFDEPIAADMSIDSLIKVDQIMQSAIDDSVFPGGVVGVVRNGSLVWQQSYGYHDYSKTKAVQPNNVYDLASISKIMATTTSMMKLVDEGKITLDDPVSKYIPEYDQGKKRDITIRHFLLHTSGLPAFRIYVDKLRTREELIEAVRNEPLINDPGEEYVYSDLGFILLAEIIEEVSGKRIDEYVQDEFFEPMGMTSTTYNPEHLGRLLTNRIPPTEIDTVYGRGLVHHRVHDERAYFMDGVSGHAGLFSSIQDMAKYFFMLLNDGVYAGHQYLSPETINLFTSHQSPINQRGLGFDRKSQGFSTAGTLTSEDSFGHTGFTGTSFWVDPNENIAIIILTNRTFPNRSYGSRISRIRAQIADAVMNSIQY
ncbi:glycoside hydrolase family 3 N-terminal domain-containing protein [Rhodohalobacter sp. 614A]|uniref:glycoside hydrolase family 3 N-terminal domain-containing protein n=1 Tax=Rhodohalobacter sp. 614A TaxID=2908649 RepID=UPI001F4534BF|nr:glycoside hydrolase family 3 N-terminal domain-containing protein [Rhodohalobacter sp. 614A]